MTQLSIIAGLGNPEDKYERTLHNAGFWFVDAVARKYGGQFRYEKKFDAEICKVGIAGEEVWLVKPQSYMNHSGQPVRVAWFPGPDGAAWVAAGDAGFKDALKDSSIEIVATRMGDTGHATQSRLIEIILDEHADELDYIAGTAVTAEAAVDVLRRRGLLKKIKVLSYYYSPDVHRGIKRGNILAAPSDQTTLQARIAMDVMVRMLEKQDYFKHVAPRVVMINASKLRDWDSSTTLAPRGFRPIFSINN